MNDIFYNLESINAKINALQVQADLQKNSIISKYAQFQKGDVITSTLTINYNDYDGGVIENVHISGGYYRNRDGKVRFHDYHIIYTVKPNGSDESYDFTEEELIKKI